ncbi:PmoA family protein [Neolewinella lacunae]|uniref:PmoA family protein n=1 Tax=Neolewinella lacunae TaxID=1517758 RepID=A0A923PNG1_9BACT|nr:PmoA family protein [Neolewinella lacunae]MBC6995645.1 PmoA family protein [Neolewinella lacunae]MDN3634288.1 PmoA family protein [Neolewinella lacunae]
MNSPLPLLLILLLASCGRAPETATSEASNLRLEQQRDYLRIYHGDRPVLNYWLTPQLPAGLPGHYTRSGFLHPVWSPAGAVVTDDFPVGHEHQHGIFTAWTHTTFRDSFVDFWNTQKELATVVHQSVEDLLDTAGYVGFTAALVHRSHAFGVILEEDLTVRVHDRSDVFVWDIRSVQRNVTADTLFLNKHLYGGFGARGSRYWNAADSAFYTDPAEFLTSTGATRDSANHTRPEWTAMYGPLPDGPAGLVVIPHPENFRWPVAVRVHPEMPYFSVSPVVEEGFALAPGQTYESRYRVLVFDGAPQPAQIDALRWEKSLGD